MHFVPILEGLLTVLPGMSARQPAEPCLNSLIVCQHKMVIELDSFPVHIYTTLAQ